MPYIGKFKGVSMYISLKRNILESKEVFYNKTERMRDYDGTTVQKSE